MDGVAASSAFHGYQVRKIVQHFKICIRVNEHPGQVTAKSARVSGSEEKSPGYKGFWLTSSHGAKDRQFNRPLNISPLMMTFRNGRMDQARN